MKQVKRFIAMLKVLQRLMVIFLLSLSYIGFIGWVE